MNALETVAIKITWVIARSYYRISLKSLIGLASTSMSSSSEIAVVLSVRELFDPNPDLRTEAQWRTLLGELVESLAQYMNISLAPTSWYTQDDKPGDASSSNCVNVRGVVSQPLALVSCGVVCICINFGEAAWASADMLLFSNGKRVFGPAGLGLVSFLFCEDGWVSQGWVVDDYGEWESHTTDARWQVAEPQAADHQRE